jgi:hypothetical protein
VVCLSVPLSGLFSGTALAAATDDHGKATAPGQVKKADATTTSSDATTTSTTSTTTSTTSTTTEAAQVVAFIGPVAPASTTSDHSQGTAATTGSVTQPQPLSNADLNAGGANNGGNCGAYCSTRDGSPSLNGNGGGAATGKPCAGCVGKADNKNPPGQAPDGSDHNNGYECDGNNGVGKTNPAHTGCKTTVKPPTPCVPTTANHNCGKDVPDCKGIMGGNTNPADCKPVTPISGGGGNPVTAPVPPVIVPNTVTPPTPVTPPVTPPLTPISGTPGNPATGTPPTVTALPFTGSNTPLLVETSLLLLLTGAGLMVATRKPRPVRSPV